MWRTALAVTALCLAAAPAGPAAAQTIVKPYFLVIVDVSGSMGDSTPRPDGGTANNSCNQSRTKINDAKCVLGKLVNSYGDVVFGLERFRQTCNSNPPTTCAWNGVSCNNCDIDGGAGCPDAGANPVRGELLVPVEEDNQARILKWVNFTCSGNCSRNAVADDPEFRDNGYTPLAGALRGARRYFEGNDPDIIPPASTPPGSPIATDTYRGCRPYRVILLTDGNETCATTYQSNLAAAELRATMYGGTPYDIRTYVIAFLNVGGGETAPWPGAEEIAQNGGTDAPGTYRAFYASDETSLSLAFAQIIADSVLVEKCNGLDDNCNGLTDEGFTLGTTCSIGTGACERDGQFVCETDGGAFSYCSAVLGDGGVEICNGLDDDCDGYTDENNVCLGCVPQPEICDGRDNDCDGRIDEEITRPCGVDVGICTRGTQTCVEQTAEQPTGTWTPCTGQGPGTEICNNLDDDCDGVTDGNAEPCVGPGNPGVGLCRPGTRLCAAGVWGQCVGETLPSDEVCDGLDNDCDGETDEGNPGGGQPCYSTCGEGVTVCQGGLLVCQGGTAGQPEVCNGVDDDCDGLIDEDQPPLGPCYDNGRLCLPGTLECVDGSYQCVGGTLPEPESCDCLDNDCDGRTDEPDENPLCPGSATCLPEPYCQCALPCSEEEFPCPTGRVCETVPTYGRYCIADPCYNKVCPPAADGSPTVCLDGTCVPVCQTVSCSPPLVCRPADGRCVEDNCLGFPDRCRADELCVDGTCERNPCAGVVCPDPRTFCTGGVCVGSCAGVDCPAGQTCHHGVCASDPCAGVACGPGWACDPRTGACVADQCGGRTCAAGLVCDPLTGDCVRDPCAAVRCPGNQTCVAGECYYPGEIRDGGIQHSYVTAIGGRGCAAAGAAPAGVGLLLLALLLVALGGRRR